MDQGLLTHEASEQLKIYGPNEITAEKKTSLIFLFFSQFSNLISLVLIAASLLSFAIKDAIDGFLILGILLLNGIFGFVQEYRAEKSLEKLKSFITPLSRVLRAGKEVQIETSEVVPGDTVILQEGDRVPADGKITSHIHIEADESILTGEAFPVIKKQYDQVFLGTLVTKGAFHLHVEKTGMNTRFGHIAKTLTEVSPDKTPLQIRLDKMGKIISLAAVFISILIIPIGLFQQKELFPLVLLSVSAGIAAIPEGLPAVVTIALAIGVNRMAAKKAIVRKLPVIETLGAVQVVLIDKTGTLTENSMRVKSFWLKNKNNLPLLLQAAALGNTASLVKRADTNIYDIVGDRTDGALLLWARQQDKDIDEIDKQGKIVEELPFDPNLKTITILWEKNGERFLFVRGAPEEILKRSKLKPSEEKKAKTLFETYAKEGLRVIAFGYKEEKHKIEDNLTFLGFAGIYDPPRKEAVSAVKEAQKAGIHTVMVTGDNELTALSIAKEVGLIQKDEDVLTGEDLEKISDLELEKIILKTRIFARTSPEDKLRLVNLLKKMGYIVGVTGDGVNDALALKRADVGIAMGETGTDVAKEASDIVLTNDNFSTLVHAVEEGRTIYKNILTSLTYLLTGNLSELTLIFMAAVLGVPNPLLPTQILWVNVITDGLPALALAADNKDHQVLKEEPRDPNAPFLSNFRLLFIFLIGISIGISLLITFLLMLQNSSEQFSRTFIFNALILLHIAMAFVVRGRALFRPNKFLILSATFILLLQFIITTNPFFQTLFHLGF